MNKIKLELDADATPEHVLAAFNAKRDEGKVHWLVVPLTLGQIKARSLLGLVNPGLDYANTWHNNTVEAARHYLASRERGVQVGDRVLVEAKVLRIDNNPNLSHRFYISEGIGGIGVWASEVHPIPVQP